MKKRARRPVRPRRKAATKRRRKRITKTKKYVRERIPSGIRNFDKLVDGGYPKESVNMIVGGAGSGKTIFATQFLVDGAQKGEPGVFVTFEENKERFYREMLALGWDLAVLEKKKLFAFIEYTPEQVKKMLDEGGGEIEVVIESIKAKRIVIDSITSFALLFEGELEKRETSLTLFELLRKWNVTSILTLEQEPSIGAKVEHISTPLEFEADGIILLYFIRPDGKRVRELEVLKMRGTNHSKVVYTFKIGRHGIRITRKARHHRRR